jgi:hypothetical protein
VSRTPPAAVVPDIAPWRFVAGERTDAGDWIDTVYEMDGLQLLFTTTGHRLVEVESGRWIRERYVGDELIREPMPAPGPSYADADSRRARIIDHRDGPGGLLIARYGWGEQ